MFIRSAYKRDMKNILTSLIAFSCVFSAQAADARPKSSSGQDARTFSYIGPQNQFGPSFSFQEQFRTISLREIREIIASQVPGDIQDARLIEDGGRKVYEVRWQPSDASLRGRIMIFIVDAESGQILSRRGG
jgi:uncharacterized membrane protein YkoI